MSLTVELVPPLRRTRTARARPRRRPPGAPTRVLLTTEGTYPYVVGGVSSWCDLLVNSLDEFDWLVLPIVAGGQPRRFALPPHARELGPIEVWSERLPRGGAAAGATPEPARGARAQPDRWNGDTDALLDAFVWCRRNPAGVRRVFRSAPAWERFLAARAARARRARARGGHAAGARPARRRAPLPDALLGRAHRRRAGAGGRRAATSPRPAGPRSPRSSTRRCTARRWC